MNLEGDGGGLLSRVAGPSSGQGGPEPSDPEGASPLPPRFFQNDAIFRELF